ncbi:MAG: hypothetical protein U0325_06485 [Polyangiales bacterium]
MRLRGLAAAAALCGCVLDFEGILAQRRDGGPRPDAGVDVVTLDRPTPEDRVKPADVPVDGPADVVAPDAGGCGLAQGVELRLAHMASRFGPMRLCMRRGAGAFAAVRGGGWPVTGIAEAEVSARFATNDVVTEQNESWQFAVIPIAQACEGISVDAPAVATVTAQLDPGDRVTLLFSSEMNSQGRLVGVLTLLQDKVCSQCPANTYDVRAVHAAFGASRARLEFAIDYVMPAPEPTLVNVFFAQSVGYGSTSPTGDRGFDCDSAWFLGAMLPSSSLVGLSAFEVGGDAVANSQRFHLKGSRLSVSRVATVFFRGDWVDGTQRPEFVLCYDGTHDAGMTVCDRIPSTAVAPLDAGTPDAGWGVDGATDAGVNGDGGGGVDATLEFDAHADDEDVPTGVDAGAPSSDVVPVAEQDVIAVGDLDARVTAVPDATAD